MAQCEYCGRDMTLESVATCKGNKRVLFPDGTELPAVAYTEVSSQNGRCPDCNIAKGGFHHPGCDREDCPKCGGQLVSCGCLGE